MIPLVLQQSTFKLSCQEGYNYIREIFSQGYRIMLMQMAPKPEHLASRLVVRYNNMLQLSLWLQLIPKLPTASFDWQ